VSNAKLVKPGCKEYHAVLQDALAKLHEFEPDEIPEIDLPAPEVTETDAGSVYRYPLPEEWGLDEGIAPSGGISEKVAVGTMFPESAKRLLTASPLTVDGPPANYDRPLAAAAWVDFAGMIDLGREWMDYGFFAWQQMQQEGGGNDAFGVAMIKGQTYMVLDLMKCFRGYASASYKEEDAMVTHYEILFKDLN